MKRHYLVLLFFIIASGFIIAFGVACQSDSTNQANSPTERRKLTIAIQPSANPSALSAESTEMKQFLEARIPNTDVEMTVPTLYAGVVESLRFGNADAAFMSAWPSALAVQRANAAVALAEVREVTIGENKEEQPFYFSYWIVRKDSPYQAIADLRGKRAAFPSQLSTSGFVIPMARLVELNLIQPTAGQPIDPKAFFGEAVFAGGYQQAYEALKNGQVDTTIIAGDVPENLYRQVLSETRIVGQQGPIPSHAVVFSKNLQDPLRTQLKNALLALGRPEHRALMRKFVSGIFVRFEEADNTHLSTLTQSLERTNLQFTEAQK